MKAATREDKPERFDTPAGIVTLQICRLSGRLASPGCEHGEAASGSGVEHQSLVYPEYFAPGTEPTTYCDLHRAPSILGTLANLLRPTPEPVPPTRAEGTSPPAAAPPAAIQTADPASQDPPASPVAAAPPPVPTSTKGFWAKVRGAFK